MQSWEGDSSIAPTIIVRERRLSHSTLIVYLNIRTTGRCVRSHLNDQCGEHLFAPRAVGKIASGKILRRDVVGLTVSKRATYSRLIPTHVGVNRSDHRRRQLLIPTHVGV